MKSLKKKKPKLLIDWCSYKAAKFACENWHYSKCLPFGKLVKFGVWENSKFIGCILYGRGAAPKLASSFGLKQNQVAELVRIALKNHQAQVSKMISISIKKLRQKFPTLELLISFADPSQGHLGSIYQATNWIYYGISDPAGGYEYLVDGKWLTCRSIGARLGTRVTSKVEKNLNFKQRRKQPRKYRYAYPLSDRVVKLLNKKKKPYPKRAANIDSDVSVDQTEKGGAIPTAALQG